MPPGIDAPPGCGNADCSVTVWVPAPNAGSPTSCSCHVSGTHIGAGTPNGSTFASFRPALLNSLTAHSIVCMNDGVAARRPQTLSPAPRLSSEKPTILF